MLKDCRVRFGMCGFYKCLRTGAEEKYDGTTNPLEFLRVYVTAITAAGGDTTVMATYFHVALSGPARTWLMNLTP
jgi:hypothetical protein